MNPRARYDHIAHLVRQTAGVPGDFAELGVWYGHTFVPLALAARFSGRVAHAVDSFEGMPDPTDRDLEPDGKCLFPAGGLDAGGTGPVQAAVEPIAGWVRIWQGWIPDVFEGIHLEDGLAFVHVDLDHYAPTRAALPWAWEHLNPGGIIAVHDYVPGADNLATAAIAEFIEQGYAPAGFQEASGHVWFRRYG